MQRVKGRSSHKIQHGRFPTFVSATGDPILRVLVVFNGEIDGADVKVVAGAAGQIRAALDDIDEDVYPLLSFVSKLEYENRL